MKLQSSNKNMLEYTSTIQNESSNDENFDGIMDDDEKKEENWGCYLCDNGSQDDDIHNLIRPNNSIDISKYLDLDNFFQYYNIYQHNDLFLYSKKETKKLIENIFIERKNLLFTFLDYNTYLYQNSDVKRIIIEYMFSENLEDLFRLNPLYKKFIYNKIFNLEINLRMRIAKLMIKDYLHNPELNDYKFLEHYSNFKYESTDFKIKFCSCFIKRGVKRLGFIKRKLLKMQHNRNVKLVKEKYSICCCKLKALTFWKSLGYLLGALSIGLICLVGILLKNHFYLLGLFILSLIGFFPILIPILLLMIDPGFKDIGEKYSKITNKICCKKSLERRNKEILIVSNKKSYMDIICCRRYEELYPGLRKPHPFALCLNTTLKRFCNMRIIGCNDCCLRLCDPRFLRKLPKYCCSCLKKIFNFKVIKEDELLNNICEEATI